MDLTRSNKPPAAVTSDAIVVGVRGGRKLTGAASQIDKALGGELSRHLEAIDFKPQLGRVESIPTFGKIPARTVLAVGLGEERVSHDEVRRAAGAAARKSRRYASVALELSDGISGGAQAAAEGFLMGAYEFTRYKTAGASSRTETLILPDRTDRKAIDRGKVIAEAVNWARDLVNEPADNRGPQEFAELAHRRAEDAGLEVDILDEKKLEKQGMNGILTVGKGSASPPRFLTITYSPRRAKGFVGAIGKGITFDSGGLSIKTAEGMTTMKTDCSGAAAVVAAMTALPALKPRIKVTAAIPLAENMPGGRAVKPGDVIRHYGGRTSEVLNTDAEGRLVLADALAWMSRQGPDAMIDFATLTGGMVIALGREVAGFFANRPELVREVQRASDRSGEPVWHMPLIDDLREELDSEVADIKNTGSRWGSPIFGGLFLKDFVGDTPWIHVDIAGPARSEKNRHYHNKGATGFGTRLLLEWIEARAAK
jgi:leucyl aminopeptidase